MNSLNTLFYRQSEIESIEHSFNSKNFTKGGQIKIPKYSKAISLPKWTKQQKTFPNLIDWVIFGCLDDDIHTGIRRAVLWVGSILYAESQMVPRIVIYVKLLVSQMLMRGQNYERGMALLEMIRWVLH